MVIPGISVFWRNSGHMSLFFSHSAIDQRGSHSQSSAVPPPIPTPGHSLEVVLSLTFGSQNCRFCSPPPTFSYHSSYCKFNYVATQTITFQ